MKDFDIIGPFAIARAIGDGAREASWWVHNSTTPGQERDMCSKSVYRTKTNIAREVALILEMDPDDLVAKVAQEEARSWNSGRYTSE